MEKGSPIGQQNADRNTPITRDPYRLESLEDCYRRLEIISSAAQLRCPLDQLIYPGHLLCFMSYQNEIVDRLNKEGIYYRDWLRAQEWGTAFDLVRVFRLVQQRDHKLSKSSRYRPHMLVQLEKEFQMRVVRRDEAGWQAHRQMMADLAKEGATKKRIRKKVEKAKKKIDAKFPLFADSILEEEKQRIQKEERDKLK